MQDTLPTLFIEINNLEYIFIAGHKNKNDQFSIIYSKKVPQEGISNKRVDNFKNRKSKY